MGFASVYGLHCRLKPKVKRAKKRKTGSRDVGSEWAKARYNWVRQLIVMFGQFVEPCPYFSIINTLKTEAPLAPYLEPSLLPKANLHNTTFWDEHHKKCVIGFVGSNSNVATLYPRDKERSLYSKGDLYTKEITFHLNVKYLSLKRTINL